MEMVWFFAASILLGLTYFAYTVWYDRKHNYDW